MTRAGAALAILLAASPAWAFSDPALFAEPAIEGGGEGRWFTGAPGDGLACGACHAPRGKSAREPDVTVEGLPERFEPGETYEVTLRWAPAEAIYALQLELVDGDGAHPSLQVAPPELLPPEARCDASPTGEPAVEVTDVGSRRIVGVKGCGARAVSLVFTAPDQPRLYLGAGIVVSDGDEDTAGDGVLELRRELLRVGEPAPGGCATSGGGDPLAVVVAAVAAWGARRRGRAGRR